MIPGWSALWVVVVRLSLNRGIREEFDEGADFDVSFSGVAQGGRGSHLVVVPTADPLMGEIPAFFEFGDDPLGGAFGDAGDAGNVADSNIWGLSDHDEYARVIRDEGPRPLFGRSHQGNSLLVVDTHVAIVMISRAIAVRGCRLSIDQPGAEERWRDLPEGISGIDEFSGYIYHETCDR